MSIVLPGTASLAQHLDNILLVQLRDGRILLGMLRSFDQFANIVLENCVERIVVGHKFGDIPLGLYIVRGENVAFLGDVDNNNNNGMEEVQVEEILELRQQEQEAKQKQEEIRKELARTKGTMLYELNLVGSISSGSSFSFGMDDL
eukprot:gb/GECH01013524.1/.p1 GENE.gb/GECH01013524.1/~~gb/GECH01013524.1/.p1  ORF type:complete len:146 (+),score=40.56 gb/GECH01013524.1/:1-438(+)